MANGGATAEPRSRQLGDRYIPHRADPTPSPDDLHLTAEALAAGRLLDIALLDHLVIDHDAYVSLRDRGVAFERTESVARAAN